jgi:hypothetical protein
VTLGIRRRQGTPGLPRTDSPGSYGAILLGADLPGRQPVGKFDGIESNAMSNFQVRNLTTLGPNLKRRDMNTQNPYDFPGVQISLCEPQSLNEGLGDWVSRDGVNLASTGGRYPRGILWPASPPTIHFRQNHVCSRSIVSE